MPPEEFEPMVLQMQRAIGQVGTASTIGRTLQWTAFGVDRRRVSTRTVQVIVTPRNGRTTIRIEEPLTQLAGGLFGGVMAGLGGFLSSVAMGVGMGTFESVPITVGLMGATLSGAYLVARTIFGRMSHGRGEALRELMSRLVEHASATAVIAPARDRPPERGSLERGG
jgi:hypothetical protein